LTAEISLSGQVAKQRLHGRVLAGFATPNSMRLEAVAPFGAPGFILVSQSGMATLLLPRDNRVLRGEKTEDALGALTGVSLSPQDLLAVLTGCVLPTRVVEGGQMHANGWASIQLRGDATVFLERVGDAWRPRLARRPGWSIDYPGWSGSFPRMIRLRSAEGAVPTVDVSATVSQLETNVTMAPDAFTVSVPATAIAITLDELRQAGPLGGSGE
jgi:hypothetical protein